jgi:8-oxo-dGTP pyrophosphatase MutT (NUDIX family)
MLRKAAVLLPVFYKDGEAHLLFIRRTERVQDHKGQVSFPGGMAEPGETDAITTALREAWEETGIRPEDVQVLGQMQAFETVSRFVITPVIGVIPHPYDFHTSEDEVDRIFFVPVNWLADCTHFHEGQYTRPDGRQDWVIFYDRYDDELIWGITAKITLNYLQSLGLFQ